MSTEDTLSVTVKLCPRKMDKLPLADLQYRLCNIVDPVYARERGRILEGPRWRLDAKSEWVGINSDTSLMLTKKNIGYADEATLFALAQIVWHFYGDEEKTCPVSQLYGLDTTERQELLKLAEELRRIARAK